MNKICLLLGGVLVAVSVSLQPVNACERCHNNYEEQDFIELSQTESADNQEDGNSGSCGPNLFWEIHTDEESEVILVVSGTGIMNNYTPNKVGNGWVSSAPWAEQNVTQVILEEGITAIGSHAFIGCNSIQSVTFPKSLNKIGASAFEHCGGLKNLMIPGNVTDIGSWSFAYCNALETVILGDDSSDNQAVYDTYCFYQCSNLERLTIEKSVYRICAHAFRNCARLKDIEIKMGLAMMDSYVFYDCPSLTCLVIPACVKQIGDNAFGMQYNAYSKAYKPIPGFVVCGYLDTAAESYAITRKITFIELEKTLAFIDRMYTIILDRQADAPGKTYWLESFKTGRESGASILEKFLLSEEIKTQNLTNKEFITRCYRALFDREADEEGYAYWLKFLEQGVSRRYVVHGFFTSKEYTQMCTRYGIHPGDMTLTDIDDLNPFLTMYIYRCYTKTLGREPEEAGRNYWISLMSTGQLKPVALAIELVHSQEFLDYDYSDKEYVSILYEMFLERSFDEDGMEYWLGQLDQGVTRDEVLECFADSVEFKIILANYGLIL